MSPARCNYRHDLFPDGPMYVHVDSVYSTEASLWDVIRWDGNGCLGCCGLEEHSDQAKLDINLAAVDVGRIALLARRYARPRAENEHVDWGTFESSSRTS